MKRLILLFLVLVIAGCTYLPQNVFKIKTEAEGSSSGYIVQDIVFPKEDARLQKANSFVPLVRLTNTGPFEADGQVCISGLDSRSFRGFTGCDCNVFSMQKEEKTFLPEDVSFGPYSVLQEEEQDYAITAITRYRYQSTAKVQMCVKNNAFDMAACSSNILSGKDGPLRISSVEQVTTPLSDQEAALSFLITVEKQADGDVWDYNAVQERCRPERDIRRNIRVNIDGLPFSVSGNCGETNFNKDEVTITCNMGEIDLIGPSGRTEFGESYNPEITVVLDYAFETRTSNKFSMA